MDNGETLETLGTRATERRQSKQTSKQTNKQKHQMNNIQTWKTKKISNTDPAKKQKQG